MNLSIIMNVLNIGSYHILKNMIYEDEKRSI